jgi:hypothetical protein
MQAALNNDCVRVFGAIQSLCEQIRSELGFPIAVWVSDAQCLLRYGRASVIVTLEMGDFSGLEPRYVLSASAFDGHHFVERDGRMLAVSASNRLRRLEFIPQLDATEPIRWAEEGSLALVRTREEIAHRIVKMFLELGRESVASTSAAG